MDATPLCLALTALLLAAVLHARMVGRKAALLVLDIHDPPASSNCHTAPFRACASGMLTPIKRESPRAA
jgi:hypothetical protein